MLIICLFDWFPNYIQTILLSEVGLNVWLWERTVQCSSSDMSISKPAKNGMQADWLCVARDQNARRTKQCHGENVPFLPPLEASRLSVAQSS